MYRNKFFIYIGLFLAILFSGFRYDAGNDFFSYYAMATGEKWNGGIELFPRLILQFSEYIESPIIFYLITSSIYILTYIYAFKKAKAFSFISVYLLLFFALSWLTSFGYVRQFQAIPFVFLAFIFLVEKKILNYIASIFIAFLFHKASIIGLFGLIYYKYFAKREHNLLLYFLLMFLAYILVSNIAIYIVEFIGLYEKYLINITNTAGSKLFLLLTTVFFINTTIAKLFNVKDKKFWIYNNLFFFGIILYSGLLNYGEYVIRIAYFFVPFFYISSYFLSTNLPLKAKQLYFLYIVGTGLFSYLATLYIASINANRDFMTNYQFHFFIN
jgi:hypothetical protein